MFVSESPKGLSSRSFFFTHLLLVISGDVAGLSLLIMGLSIRFKVFESRFMSLCPSLMSSVDLLIDLFLLLLITVLLFWLLFVKLLLLLLLMLLWWWESRAWNQIFVTLLLSKSLLHSTILRSYHIHVVIRASRGREDVMMVVSILVSLIFVSRLCRNLRKSSSSLGTFTSAFFVCCLCSFLGCLTLTRLKI